MPLAKTIVSAAVLGVVLGVLLGSMLFAGLEAHASKETVGVLDAELWDARTGRWSPAGVLARRRVTPDLVPLEDGGVLVVGGYSDMMMPALMTLAWSPVTRTFKDAWSPDIALGCRAALPLPDGRVLLSSTEETDNWGIAVNHAELWDPRTQKGTTVAMSPNLGVRAAAPLAGGRVLFVFASSAAVWNEQTRAWTGLPEAVKGKDPLDCGESARALTLAGGRVLVISRFFRAGAEAWAWLWDPATGVLARAAALEQALTAADSDAPRRGERARCAHALADGAGRGARQPGGVHRRRRAHLGEGCRASGRARGSRDGHRGTPPDCRGGTRATARRRPEPSRSTSTPPRSRAPVR